MSQEQSQEQGEHSSNVGYWMMVLSSDGSDLNSIQEIYRFLSKSCHPDAGGDERVMRAINAAYDNLKRQFIRRPPVGCRNFSREVPQEDEGGFTEGIINPEPEGQAEPDSDWVFRQGFSLF